MLFLLHLLGLLWAAGGALFTFCLSSSGSTKLPEPVMDNVQKLYPVAAFTPEWDGDSGEVKSASKQYLITGGVFAYCFYYLFKRHR